EFITPVPHVSFVTGEAGRSYMRNRYEALARQPLFAGLEYAESQDGLADWIPLMMAGRDTEQVVAGPRSVAGTAADFGTLTRLRPGRRRRPANVRATPGPAADRW